MPESVAWSRGGGAGLDRVFAEALRQRTEPERSERLANGTVLGSYRITGWLGSGGMGDVYVAEHVALGRRVALKRLRRAHALDRDALSRFFAEARAVNLIRHENIVQVIDYGRFDDLSYIAMEFVEGLDLKQWMEAHGAPPVEMALLMLRDICRGLEHAHAHNIVHRDIKPANVMLTPDGTIKIMDFGLARRGEDSTSVTVAGSTPASMNDAGNLPAPGPKLPAAPVSNNSTLSAVFTSSGWMESGSLSVATLLAESTAATSSGLSPTPKIALSFGGSKAPSRRAMASCSGPTLPW